MQHQQQSQRGSINKRRGNKLYDKFKNELEMLGYSVEPMAKYPFAHVFYYTPIYKHRITTIPMFLTPYGYNDTWARTKLNKQSTYEEMKADGRLEDIQTRTNRVNGYYFLREQIKKRTYLLRNSLEFNDVLHKNTMRSLGY